MVAYLKASVNEKMYSEHLQVAREAKKEEAVESSNILATVSTSKPYVTSFFPQWKLKSSKPPMALSMEVAHLEEKSVNEEEDVNGDDPDGIKGITRVHSTSH